MSRIKGKDQIKSYLKKYGSSGVDYFTLKNDGDTATVRFLHQNDEDLDLALVHKVEIDDKDKYVECLEENCPFCEEFGRPSLKLFLFVYDIGDEKVKVWERGPTMIDPILGFIDKYGEFNNRNYEIKRHGKKGDTQTQYQLFPEDKGLLMDPKGNEIPIPEKPKLFGRFVLQMDADAMAEFIQENAPVPKEKGKESTKDKKKGPGF
jgi:hypothetical protein